MPKIEKMLETMREQGIPEETISKFTLPRIKKATPKEIVEFTRQMDEFLSDEQCIRVMDEQGCNKTNKVSARFRVFGEKYADKTIEERLELWSELDSPHKAKCRLNKDGTLSIIFGRASGENYDCPCNPIKKLKPYDFPLTYCGCCGAHVRYSHEFALGVKLRLKEIVSSMANSNGAKRCEFLYEVIE
jgi:hypothetical protein